jgi:hypothetical protein
MRSFKPLRPLDEGMEFDATGFSCEPQVEIQESASRIRILYSFPGFYLSDDEQEVDGRAWSFNQVSIDSAGMLAESGKPQLPSFGRYVQIPQDCDYKLSVYPGEPVEFDDVVVAPAQAELSDAVDEKTEFEYDSGTYDSSDVFPPEMVRVSGPYEMDSYNALLVHVCPFEYLPAKKRLIGFANLEVIVDLVPLEHESDFPNSDPVENYEAYGNLMMNPARNISERLRLAPGTRVLPSLPVKSGPELLIIHATDFKIAAQKLANWKNARGLQSQIVSIAQVGNEVAKIKKFIRNRRRARILRRRFYLPKLRYVLLLGDVDTIVSEIVPDPDNPNKDNATDYYYSTSKDPDGNELIFPWISIGRIPVDNTAQADDVVDQIIKYEKNPPADPDYYRNMTFGAYFQDIEWYQSSSAADGRATRQYMKTMEIIHEHMEDLGFDVERAYVSQFNDPELNEYRDGTAVPQEVKDAIVDNATATDMMIDATREGRLLIGHRDHGSPDGWHRPAFEQNHLPQADGDVPSVFYSVNCQTGRFDSTNPQDSFAEAILAMNGGAPSLIAATRNSHSFLNDDLMLALFDGMWGGVLPTFPDGSTASYPVRNNRLGDLLNYSKSYLPIGMAGGEVYIKDHFEIYHVVGDPSLEVWRDEPVSIKFTAKLSKQRVRPKRTLNIRLSSCPEGSVITVWYGKEMIKRIEPRSTLVSLPVDSLLTSSRPGFPNLRRNMLFVCFKAPGCRFRQVRVRLI